MLLFLWQICLIIRGQNRPHGIIVMNKKGSLSSLWKKFQEVNRFMTAMEGNVIPDSSLTMALSI